jgi:hypothetical protein
MNFIAISFRINKLIGTKLHAHVLIVERPDGESTAPQKKFPVAVQVEQDGKQGATGHDDFEDEARGVSFF